MAKSFARPVVETLDNGDISFKRPSQAKEIFRRLRKNKGAMIGLFLLICIILVVIFADLIAPYEAGVVQVAENKLAPMSAEHPWAATIMAAMFCPGLYTAPATRC